MAEQQLRVRLLALTQGFNRNMATAQSRLTAFGTKAKQVGASLRSIQLPLALAGGAAVKMGYDFDKSMTQIKSLVGVAGAEVDAMGERAKRMAADTGQSANSAAEALFFITSAGLRGEEAMQVLEASLKAAAVGLGETKTVADLATSAMNAYGSDVLSASNATDILVSAVREGKLEASALAGSMGSVLPIASAMGVRFDEVGAAFAALSRTGTNAAEAATQIRGILLALLKPTTAAQKALSEMGLSSQGLRQQIREKGLLSALETLKKSFEGNDDATQAVFGNVRALLPIYDLLGANVQTTRDIFDSMTQSAGATEKAFKATSESASFRLQKALNGLRISFTELGTTLLSAILPLVQRLTTFINKLFAAFNELSPNVKAIVLAMSGFALVLPTVISLVGTIATALGALLSPIGLVIAALAGVTYAIVKNWQPVKQAIVDVINYFIDLYNESEGFRLIIQGIGGIFKGLFEVGKRVFQGLWNIVKIVAENIMTAFKSAGKVIKGVFTLDWQLIEDGFKEGIGSAINSVVDVVKEADAAIMDAAGLMIYNIGEGVKRAKQANPIELVTGEDIDNFLTRIKDKIQNAGKFLFGSLQQGVSDAAQEAGGGGAALFESTGFGDITKNVQSTMAASLMLIGSSFDSITERTKRLHEFVKNNAVSMGNALAGAFNRLLDAKNPIEALEDMLVSLIKRLVAAALAAAVLSAIIGSLSGGASLLESLGGFKGLFTQMAGFGGGSGFMGGGQGNISSMGNLGIQGAMRNDSINLAGQFRLDGQDLVLAVERANNVRGSFI
jgi:TP901 family phage tail tape measure protein